MRAARVEAEGAGGRDEEAEWGCKSGGKIENNGKGLTNEGKMVIMEYMISIKNIVKLVVAPSAAVAILISVSGCATTKNGGAQPPVAEGPVPLKTLSETQEIPDGGLSPVAEPPQHGSWGSTFMPRGD